MIFHQRVLKSCSSLLRCSSSLAINAAVQDSACRISRKPTSGLLELLKSPAVVSSSSIYWRPGGAGCQQRALRLNNWSDSAAAAAAANAVSARDILYTVWPYFRCFLTQEKKVFHPRVDFFIPGLSVVGGFSICSSPGLLEREGVLELAVKQADHPPAQWIHTKCALGSEVALRVGGDFFFDPQPGDSPVKLVLIAGGVGINPLFSILLHIADLHGYQEGKGNGYKMGTVNLYYSAKKTSELLFKQDILGLMAAFPGKITCRFHITQQRSQTCEELQPHVTEGRISGKDLANHVSKDTLWYICGPPPMIESISNLLSSIGVPRDCVFFEKWW